jgi:D-xylose 1-dehydrogenase (NADP+, D-xylono-1,5-lactone-forming)
VIRVGTRSDPLGLGLLSTADINGAIVRAAAQTDAVDVVAVGSRSAPRAEAHAREHGIPRAHGSYGELLADDQVEAVYVSLPNGLHAEWTLRALEAGRHVLVEKPFSSRVADVERCFDAAESRGLVLSEAFMWRHHPQADQLVALVRDGVIGELREIRARFGFVLADRGDPRWDPALDGGSLMDVGCYCVSAARLLAGEPERIEGSGTRSRSGVDARFEVTLRFPGGVVAELQCAFDEAMMALEVTGTDGRLALADPWHCVAPSIELDGEPLTVERIKLEIERVFSARGVVGDEFIVSHGAQTAIGHEMGSGALLPDEPIVFDLFPRDRETGVYSDMTRTYVVGEPPDEVKEWHALVKRALETSTAGIKPGVNGRALFEGVCEQFQEAGYKTQLNKDPGEVLEDGFFHSLGHGVGLEVHELPSLGRSGHELVPGDVVTIEPGLYRSGFGGLRLEDIVLVTDDGHEVLTDYPYELAP